MAPFLQERTLGAVQRESGPNSVMNMPSHPHLSDLLNRGHHTADEGDSSHWPTSSSRSAPSGYSIHRQRHRSGRSELGTKGDQERSGGRRSRRRRRDGSRKEGAISGTRRPPDGTDDTSDSGSSDSSDIEVMTQQLRPSGTAGTTPSFHKLIIVSTVMATPGVLSLPPLTSSVPLVDTRLSATPQLPTKFQPRKAGEEEMRPTKTGDWAPPVSTPTPGGIIPDTRVSLLVENESIEEGGEPFKLDRYDMSDTVARPNGLGPTAEHVLIAGGSIGAADPMRTATDSPSMLTRLILGSFILMCAMGWIIYRLAKRFKRRNREVRNQFQGRMPWKKLDLSPRHGTWPGDDRPSVDIPIREKRAVSTSGLPSVLDYYAAVSFPRQADEGMAGEHEGSQGGATDCSVATGMAGSQQAISRLNPATDMQFGRTPARTETNLTVRPRVPGEFYNQSELARQPSDAYDPGKRQVNRASELSSLSSGFGDGDIAIPASLLQAPPSALPHVRQSSSQAGRRSWRASRGNRETVYTESSEDSPARFRTVNSWVNQQTGRVRRAQQGGRADQEVPPLPGMPGRPGISYMPPEQQLNMMMDDELPRKVEMTCER